MISDPEAKKKRSSAAVESQASEVLAMKLAPAVYFTMSGCLHYDTCSCKKLEGVPTIRTRAAKCKACSCTKKKEDNYCLPLCACHGVCSTCVATNSDEDLALPVGQQYDGGQGGADPDEDANSGTGGSAGESTTGGSKRPRQSGHGAPSGFSSRGRGRRRGLD
jgi:hypothetical protein